MKQAILALVLAITLAHAASALTFDFRANAINDTIFGDEQAVFIVTVYNQNTGPASFEITPDPINWVGTVETNPLEIPGFGSRSVTVSAKPKSTLNPGSHALGIKVTLLEESKSITKTVPVYIKPYDPGYGWYTPSIALGTEIPASIDPRNTVKVGIYLRNRNQLNITGLQIGISSPLFEKKYFRELGPLTEDREEYLFQLNPLQKPGTYPVMIELSYQGTVTNTEKKTFDVQGYTVPTETKDEHGGLFKKTMVYTVKNDGNDVLQRRISLPDHALRGLFSTYSEPPTRARENGERHLAWDLEVPPQSTHTITITQNYQLAIAILVIILVIVITYASTRSPVTIVKEAKEESHEGQRVVKVRILIRNRSNKPQYRIVLKDRVPPLAVVVKRAHIGTLQPASVRPDRNQGTILTWELDVLEPHEERLVAYIIQTRLKVLGGFTLKPARTSFQYRNRERIVRSNQVMVRHP